MHCISLASWWRKFCRDWRLHAWHFHVLKCLLNTVSNVTFNKNHEKSMYRRTFGINNFERKKNNNKYQSLDLCAIVYYTEVMHIISKKKNKLNDLNCSYCFKISSYTCGTCFHLKDSIVWWDTFECLIVFKNRDN